MLPFVASYPGSSPCRKMGRSLGTRLTICSFMQYTNHCIAWVVLRHCMFTVNFCCLTVMWPVLLLQLHNLQLAINIWLVTCLAQVYQALGSMLAVIMATTMPESYTQPTQLSSLNTFKFAASQLCQNAQTLC